MVTNKKMKGEVLKRIAAKVWHKMKLLGNRESFLLVSFPGVATLTQELDCIGFV